MTDCAFGWRGLELWELLAVAGYVYVTVLGLSNGCQSLQRLLEPDIASVFS